MASETKQSKTSIQESVGVDFGTTSTKVVKIRKSGAGYSLIGADVMEPYAFGVDAEPDGKKLGLGKKCQAAYAGACMTAPDANLRFL